MGFRRDGRGREQPPEVAQDDAGRPRNRPQWLDRKQIAALLGCTPSNVRRLQDEGQLNRRPRASDGHIVSLRIDVEALARKRGIKLNPDGFLTAQVFALIKEGCSFQDICIKTLQDAETVRRLWHQYEQGAQLDDERRAVEARERTNRERENRELEEHEKMIREWDREIEEKRRRALSGGNEDDDWPSLSPPEGRKGTGRPRGSGD